MQERVSKLLTFAAWAVLALLLGPPVVVLVEAYSDATQEIHRDVYCAADGWCSDEMYVVREDPLQQGRVKIDYVPATNAYVWNILVRNLRNATADGLANYDTEGCLTFFLDCPSTTHEAWLYGRETVTVMLDTDTTFAFRLVNVPRPWKVTVDGAPWDQWSNDDWGPSVSGIQPGLREVVFYVASPGGPYNPATTTFRYELLTALNGCTFRLTFTGGDLLGVESVRWHFPGNVTQTGLVTEHTFVSGCNWLYSAWAVRLEWTDKGQGLRSSTGQVVLDRRVVLVALVVGTGAILAASVRRVVVRGPDGRIKLRRHTVKALRR